MPRFRNRSRFSSPGPGGGGGRLGSFLIIVLILLLLAGGGFLAIWDPQPQSAQVEKPISDERLRN